MQVSNALEIDKDFEEYLIDNLEFINIDNRMLTNKKNPRSVSSCGQMILPFANHKERKLNEN